MKTSMQNYDSKKMSKVVGRNLPFSFKVAYEVAKYIRGMKVDRAIRELKEVQKIKKAIPYTRYNRDTPHRRGAMASGRYPEKAARYVIPLLKSLKTNAEDKGIEGELEIVHSAANKPSIRRRYGRVKGTKRLTHFELVAMPQEVKK
jgi:large subunit ribosomal protein L22